jgi:hypothetical protein
MTKLKSRGEMVGSILGGELTGGREMESPLRPIVRLPVSGEPVERGVVLVVVLVEGAMASSSSSSSSDWDEEVDSDSGIDEPKATGTNDTCGGMLIDRSRPIDWASRLHECFLKAASRLRFSPALISTSAGPGPFEVPALASSSSSSESCDIRSRSIEKD